MASITSILREFPLVVLDGAFGTEIARRGFDTRDDLWAAKALFEKPVLKQGQMFAPAPVTRRRWKDLRLKVLPAARLRN